MYLRSFWWVPTTCFLGKYRIRPNYRTVRSGFSILLRTLICGKICIYLLRIHYKKRSEKNLFDDDYAIFSDFLYKGICCGYSFELHRQVNAIQMSTHNICLHKEVKKKYTGYNLKTMKLLDCALIGVCAVIRSNTVRKMLSVHPSYLELWYKVSFLVIKFVSFCYHTYPKYISLFCILPSSSFYYLVIYLNFCDRMANNVDSDQTAVWSGSALFAIACLS